MTMPYQRLLNDFIDGSLDYQGEAALFAELGVNDELRREMKTLLLVRRAASNDTRAYTPAPDSADAIFRRLGFAAGMPGTEEGAPHGTWLGGTLRTVFGGVLGTLVVAMTLLLWSDRTDRYGGSTGRNAADRSNAGNASEDYAGTTARDDRTLIPGGIAAVYSVGAGITPHPAAGITANGITPSHGTSRAATARNITRHDGNLIAHSDSRRDGTRIDATNRTATSRRDHAAAETPAAAHTVSVDRVALLHSDAAVHETLATIRRPLRPLEAPIAAANDAPGADAMLTATYRNVVMRNMQSAPMQVVPTALPILRDKAVGLFARLGDRDRIGIEFGQEDFYQRYDETLENGDIIRHEQDPILLWGGVAYRRTLLEAGGFAPYAQALIGATRSGPAGRLSLGTAFTLAPGLQAFASAEVGGLAYRFNGAWFTSPKYGFSYGASFEF